MVAIECLANPFQLYNWPGPATSVLLLFLALKTSMTVIIIVNIQYIQYDIANSMHAASEASVATTYASAYDYVNTSPKVLYGFHGNQSVTVVCMWNTIGIQLAGL